MKLLNYPGLEQKIGLKEIMTHGERVIPKVKLDLKLQFKTNLMTHLTTKPGLCDYIDAYILVKGTITITGAGDNAASRQINQRDKGLIFKKCVLFTDWISKINNIQVDNTKDLDVMK